MNTTLFEEKQRFTLWWMWLLMLTGLLLPLIMVIFAFASGAQEIFSKKDTTVLLAMFLIYNFPILILFFYARLTTKITKEGIYYGWNMPTAELNFIHWNDIKTCELVEHRFVGYGYKVTKTYGVVYNTSGKHGLWVTKQSGERILIGTLNVEKMKSVLLELRQG